MWSATDWEKQRMITGTMEVASPNDGKKVDLGGNRTAAQLGRDTIWVRV